MEVRKILFRKETKLLTLLLTSLFIASASAAVYNYMYMQSSGIAAESPTVKFVSAADSTAAGFSVTGNGTYASFNSMSGWPGALRIYQAACGIENTAVSARTIELKFDQAGDWSGNTGSIDSMTVIIRDTAGGTQQGTTITVGTAGSTTGSLSLTGSTTWVVEWNIKWKTTALATDTVTVMLSLVVTGE